MAEALSPFFMFPGAHDPGTRQDWTIPFAIDAGLTVTSATVYAADSAGVALVSPDITIDSVTWAALDATSARWLGVLDPAKNNWAVSFFAQAGTAQIYTVRAPIFLSSNTSGIPDQILSMALRCGLT